MKTKYNPKTKTWTARDPSEPRAKGKGRTEEDAIADLEAQLEELSYPEEITSDLGWPE